MDLFKLGKRRDGADVIGDDTPTVSDAPVDFEDTKVQPAADIPITDTDSISVPRKVEMIPGIVTQKEKVGTIYGTVGTNSFDCHVCAHLERSEYVMVQHEDYGYVLCQVGNLVRKSNLS